MCDMTLVDRFLNNVSFRCVDLTMKNLCAIILAVVATSVLADSLSFDERLQLANGLYARDMLTLAADEYRSLVESFPDNPKVGMVRFRMGESYRRLGKRSEAGKEFEYVFTKCPKSEFRFKAGFRSADLSRLAGEHKKAIIQYRKLVDSKPPKDIAASTLYFLGDSLLALGQASEATKAFERVTKEHGESDFSSFALLKLGQIRGQLTAEEEKQLSASEKKKRLVEALALYRRVVVDPSSERVGAEALFQTAELQFGRGAFAESATAYRKLLATYPKDQRSANATLRAAWAMHNAGLYAEALKYAQQAVSSASSASTELQAEWLYLKANCERQLMKTADAITTYSRLLEDHPRSAYAASARYEKAVTFYKMGKFGDAIAAARQISLTGDIKQDVYWLLAESHAATGQDNEAVQYYRLIAREFPKSDVAGEAMYRLAHHLRIKGQHKEAATYYAKVVDGYATTELAPQSLFASAVCLTALKMHAEAARDWNRLIKNYPRHDLVEESLYQKAMGDIRLQRDDESLASLHQLIKAYPKSKFLADAHYWRGILYKEDGKFQAAEAEFRTAIGKAPRKEVEQDASFQLAVVLQRTGKSDEAATLFQAVLASPQRTKCSPALLEWLSEYMLAKELVDEAIVAAKALVESAEDAAWQQIGWCLVGRGLNEKGDVAGAEKAFRASLATKARTPFAAEAALRLGTIALATKKHEAAGDYFRQAASLASAESMLAVRARAYAGIGRSALAAGDLENAARYFMSVAILYDDAELVSECLYEAATVFKKQGKQDETDKALAELKKRYPESKWAVKSVNTQKP